MFRIVKNTYVKKKLLLTLPKKNYGLRNLNLWAWKNFGKKSLFFSSQWIKSQKMVRIMKKDACETCLKIGS